jgi:predicted RNase H-related nuclease YkuK (DUF458 family)
MWKNGKKKSVTWEEIISFISDRHYLHSVFVGTDSQPFRSGDCVVTAVCVLSDSKEHDSRFFYCYHKDVEPVPKDMTDNGALFVRLYNEAMKTINVANELRSAIPSLDITVHLDVQNQESAKRSSKFASSLTSLALGYGFQFETKPRAWVASSIADKFTKKPPRKP